MPGFRGRRLADCIRKTLQDPSLLEKPSRLEQTCGKRTADTLLTLIEILEGEQIRHRRIKRNYTPEEDKVIIEMRRAGKSYAEIARVLGRTPSSVAYRAKRLGLDRPEIDLAPPGRRRKTSQG